MKKCPYCGHENADGAGECLICHTNLDPAPVPSRDPQAEDPALAARVVATFANVVDADVFKTRLEAAGIDAFVPEEYTPQILWAAITSPLERVTVRVAARDYAAARALYESAEASTAVPPEIPPSNTGTSAGAEGGTTRTVACAECGKSFQIERTIQYGEARVCATCKPIFLQRIQEGGAVGAETGPSKLCVACNGKMPEKASVCPNCGYTQPGA